jgi:hypothetical protein
MKNKLFLIALCAGIQANISFAGEKQSWADWFRAKYAQVTGSRYVREKAEKAPYLVTGGVIGVPIIGQAGANLLRMPSFVYDFIYRHSSHEEFLQYLDFIVARDKVLIVGGAVLGIALAESIYQAVSYYRFGATSKAEALFQIKDALSLLINDSSLYPTRSSKIHALLKKDEFVQYVTDEYGLVQDACNELIKNINQAPYSEDQKAKDAIIDQKMAEVRKSISNYETLDDQITALENQKQNNMDISTMQAYTSVYLRLKNKQAVENKLPEIEKASRQAERSELQTAREYLGKKEREYLGSEEYFAKQQKKAKAQSEAEALKNIQ